MVRVFFVTFDFDPNMTRLTRDRSLDPFLEFAVAELYEAVFIEAKPGNSALFRCIDQRLRTRTEFLALGEADE